MDALVFNLKGNWGHFRKVSTNTVKRSYLVPPKTTVAGLLAGVVGMNRDSYYEEFNNKNCQFSVSVESDLRTINVPIKMLKMDSSSRKTLNSRGKPTVSFPDSRGNRQINTHEYIVDPVYKIYLSLEDKDLMDEIKRRLIDNEYYYTPSLGLSELLCDIEYVGEFEVVDSNSNEVDSVVSIGSSDIIPVEGVSYSKEKQPSQMKNFDNFRKTTDFVHIAFSKNSDSSLRVKNSESVKSINGDDVVLY